MSLVGLLTGIRFFRHASTRQPIMKLKNLVHRSKETSDLIIGIDFGTTFSGIAWALTSRPDQIHMIEKWQSNDGSGFKSPKVPSKIAYNRDGTVSTWGFKSENPCLNWFKLLLCEEAEDRAASQEALFSELRSELDRLRKKPEDVVADYLEQVWKHARFMLQLEHGKALDKMNMRVVVTVPAIWDHVAKDLTKKAVIQAIRPQVFETDVQVIGEPEAAALAVFDDMQKARVQQLDIDDCFVVCDCGGGTVVSNAVRLLSIESLLTFLLM